MATILIGNDGDDQLYGGAGANTLIGGKGNDGYYVDSVLDRIIELPGEGADRVEATVSFTLPENGKPDAQRRPGHRRHRQ